LREPQGFPDHHEDIQRHTGLRGQRGESRRRQAGKAIEDGELEERERTTTTRDRKGGRTNADSSTASSSASSASKKPRLDQISSGNLDADDPVDEDDDEEEDSDEDDTAELMAELSRIKKERAAEKAQQEAAKAVEEEQIRTDNILHGNPLLNQGKTDFKVKRRWDDDVVFKNCAKGMSEHGKDPSFINDSIRSEFHKKFMEKYIK